MAKRNVFLLFTLIGLACGAEQEGPLAGAAEPGEPIPGLTEAERGRFLLGKAVFDRLTTPEEGLGPLFNEARCSTCHDVPASGGSGPALVTKVSRFEDGTCNLLVGQGGDNIQRRATPLLVAEGIEREAVPELATAEVSVTGPSLFGLGLVESIPEDSILANADPDDADGDGVSGRAVRTESGELGRFGRKNEIATVLDFNETALRFELGLTTHVNPVEETVNGVPIPPETDPFPEPEIDKRGLGILTDYVRFLAPPAPEVPATAETADSILGGERIFAEIGCATCHVPSFQSGRVGSGALSNREVRLYSDLLLHDMGPELADVCGPSASPAEYRTARLWGLRYRSEFLHNGQAKTVEEAIALHGGEGTGARAGYSRLTDDERAYLLRFLASL
jgi:CxxC motif-containing protein (DUF1111 family)